MACDLLSISEWENTAKFVKFVSKYAYWKKLHFCVIFPRITITTKGKNSAIEANAIPNLVKLLGDSESEVRLNALKVSYHPT